MPADLLGNGIEWSRSSSPAATSLVGVDLPAGEDSAGLEQYAEVIRIAVGDRDSVVLFAQSMGALPASVVAADDSIVLMMLVNAMVPRPGESGGEWWVNTGWGEARAEYAAGQGREALGRLIR